MTYTAVDLYAGPGGWSVAAAKLGLVEYGVEWDAAACETARAAGHHRRQVDVRAIDPRLARGVSLLIASPPCQGFSMAGLGAGRGIMPQLVRAVADLADGLPVEEVRDRLADVCHDDRVGLVVEPMHWIVQAQPRNVALEQVPAVLPLWEAMATEMRKLGYSVATGNLQAEQYDVPQTRKRAILVASLDREVALPTPVRSKYRKGHAPEGLPWISMAQALGWTGGVIRSNYGTGGDASLRGERASGEPSATVTSKVGRNKWQLAAAASTRPLDRTKPRDLETEPATTVAFGHNGAKWRRQNEDQESVRVTVAEAAVLQGFPADYPWQGTKTKQYEQVGNAVPPPLAWHVLRAVLGLPVEHYPLEPRPFPSAPTS